MSPLLYFDEKMLILNLSFSDFPSDFPSVSFLGGGATLSFSPGSRPFLSFEGTGSGVFLSFDGAGSGFLSPIVRVSTGCDLLVSEEALLSAVDFTSRLVLSFDGTVFESLVALLSVDGLLSDAAFTSRLFVFSGCALLSDGTGGFESEADFFSIVDRIDLASDAIFLSDTSFLQVSIDVCLSFSFSFSFSMVDDAEKGVIGE